MCHCDLNSYTSITSDLLHYACSWIPSSVSTLLPRGRSTDPARGAASLQQRLQLQGRALFRPPQQVQLIDAAWHRWDGRMVLPAG